jgi:hypothetical protein
LPWPRERSFSILQPLQAPISIDAASLILYNTIVLRAAVDVLAVDIRATVHAEYSDYPDTQPPDSPVLTALEQGKVAHLHLCTTVERILCSVAPALGSARESSAMRAATIIRQARRGIRSPAAAAYAACSLLLDCRIIPGTWLALQRQLPSALHRFFFL